MEEQREEVIKENNTAQDTLISTLESMSKSSRELKIEEALFGDLDFSVLKEMGFANIKSIILKDGQITNIDGLNTLKSLVSFECTNNLLLSLEDLPDTLQHLSVGFNHIGAIDLKHIKDLRTLILSHNKVTELSTLPKTLTELVCDNNKLQSLDLEGLDELKILVINNNPITLIENLPTTVVDFQMENCPSIEFRNSMLPELRAENKDAEKELKDHQNYLESLKEYFKIKQQYETKLKKLKRTAFMKEPSRRLGRLAALSVKPQCINCKRPVGTIFSNREGDIYTAICGDKGNPCNLQIKIYNGKIINLPYILKIYQEEITDLKDTIIRQKLDTLFSYVSEEESVKLFKKELETYNTISKMYKQLSEKYVDLYDSKDEKVLVQKKNDEIFVLVEKVRDLLKEYELTENPGILKAAMDLQVNELYPEIRNLRLLKKEVVELIEPEEEFYQVFRYPVSLDKIDHDGGEKAAVIKFTME